MQCLVMIVCTLDADSLNRNYDGMLRNDKSTLEKGCISLFASNLSDSHDHCYGFSLKLLSHSKLVWPWTGLFQSEET